MAESVAFAKKERCFLDQNGSKGRENENGNEFWLFSNIEMNVAN